jgi:hypothetical protein
MLFFSMLVFLNIKEVDIVTYYSKSFRTSIIVVYKDAEVFIEEVLMVIENIKFGKKYLGILGLVDS